MSTADAAKQVAEAAKLSKRSQLNQWMARVRKEREADIHYPDGPAATALLYTEMPKYYTWNLHNQRKWQRRVQCSDSFETVSRLYTVHPKDHERFHLRTLLLHRPGIGSVAEMSTTGGQEYATFRETCLALHYLDDDGSRHDALKEARAVLMPVALRNL